MLNPSVVKAKDYLNFYSVYDGKTWRTNLATSPDGFVWQNQKQILEPDPTTWEGSYIAGNGSAIQRDQLYYYYQAGRATPNRLAARFCKTNPTSARPRAHTEAGTNAGSPIRMSSSPRAQLYMFYTGMDRARRQRLGVAQSSDGLSWHKLRSNPILELGSFGNFDENGLGEPAVWASHGYWWMLYTGQDRFLNRRLGLARSQDGIPWTKQPNVFAGSQPWDSKVICDPTVLVENGEIRVWFGGGDIARPDQEIHGQIGYAVLRIY